MLSLGVALKLEWWDQHLNRLTLNLVVGYFTTGWLLSYVQAASPIYTWENADCTLPTLSMALAGIGNPYILFGLLAGSCVLALKVLNRRFSDEKDRDNREELLLAYGWGYLLLYVIAIFMGMFVLPLGKCGS